jgi:LPXTG-motif cell wall-anchored protein
MRISHRLVCLLAVLILAAPAAALPAAAFGQSAGDDQYVDPFQNNDKGDDGNAGSGSQGGDNSNNAAQQGTDQSNSGDSAGTTAAQSSAADENGKLPHTGSGLPEGWLVAAGVILLLGGGFVLRRVWPHPD